jgi:hypothetical protein
MSDLIQYVKDRENREDILFLAIFTDCAQHIGNIKYESINFDFDLIQLPFNVFDNRLIVKGQLKKLKAKSIEIHARSVFLQGILLNFDNLSDYFLTWERINKKSILFGIFTLKFIGGSNLTDLINL